MKKKMLSMLLVSFLFLSITTTFAEAVDKLIVKDSVGDTKFIVTDEGKLGVGTSSPVSQVHVQEAVNSLTAFRVENPFMVGAYDAGSAAQEQVVLGPQGTEHLILQATSDSHPSLPNVAFLNSVTHNFFIRTNGKNVLKVMRTGAVENTLVMQNGNVGFGVANPENIIELSGGAYSDGSTWVNASSRELKENIKEVSVEDAVATLEKLVPVTYNYRKDKKEQHVGFIAEDVPDMVATNDRKGLNAMDVTSILTKVVQEQQKMIADLRVELAEVKVVLSMTQEENFEVSQLLLNQN